MQDQINQLKNDLAKLQQDFQNLKDATSIPKDVQDALTTRLGLTSLTNLIAKTGTGTAGSTVVYNAFPVTVPANPSGTLTVKVKGVTYNILLK